VENDPTVSEYELRADARRVIERIDILPDCPPDAAFHVANDAAAVLRRFLEARPREESPMPRGIRIMLADALQRIEQGLPGLCDEQAIANYTAERDWLRAELRAAEAREER
jgi:hypothetical protein